MVTTTSADVAKNSDAAKTAVKQSVDSLMMRDRLEIGLTIALKDLPKPSQEAFLGLVTKMGQATVLLRDIERMRNEGDQKGCNDLESLAKELNASRATILGQMGIISRCGAVTVREVLINSGEDIPTDKEEDGGKQ